MIATEGRIDLSRTRSDFPILRTEAYGQPLVYLDNAATSQKPQHVLDVLQRYWTSENANVHRGVHYLSQKATREYDASREKIRLLLNAPSSAEVILTKGCTEGINLVATCLTGSSPFRLKEGDEILVSTMEHHSNIVPWQLAAERVGATVRPIPVTDSGEIDLDGYREMLKSGRVRVVAVVHVSNSLGTINPIKEIARMAHEVGALVLVDGAQAGPHTLVDVQDLDADFYTLSCHKIYAPTGVGVLFGKRHLLEAFPPYHGGGDMIRTVSFEKTTYADLPAKYEAGTPNIAGVIGLGAAIDYLMSLSGVGVPHALEDGAAEGTGSRRRDARATLASVFEAIHSHELGLAKYTEERLTALPGVRIVGTAAEKAGIVSFVMEQAHPHDIGTILDQQGIAIRAGHHCCMPLMKRLAVPATARASFAFYNTYKEADKLIDGVKKVAEMFA